MKDCIYYTIHFRELVNLSLTYELYELVLLDCHFIYKIVTSPEDESSVLSKHCVTYFVCCDSRNSTESYQ